MLRSAAVYAGSPSPPGACDTLVADGDGVYHPGLFNDRLVLGVKGTMAEAELHVLRARLEGGIRSKTARGELRRGLPVGLIRDRDAKFTAVGVRIIRAPVQASGERGRRALGGQRSP